MKDQCCSPSLCHFVFISAEGNSRATGRPSVLSPSFVLPLVCLYLHSHYSFLPPIPHDLHFFSMPCSFDFSFATSAHIKSPTHTHTHADLDTHTPRHRHSAVAGWGRGGAAKSIWSGQGWSAEIESRAKPWVNPVSKHCVLCACVCACGWRRLWKVGDTVPPVDQ